MSNPATERLSRTVAEVLRDAGSLAVSWGRPYGRDFAKAWRECIQVDWLAHLARELGVPSEQITRAVSRVHDVSGTLAAAYPIPGGITAAKLVLAPFASTVPVRLAVNSVMAIRFWRWYGKGSMPNVPREVQDRVWRIEADLFRKLVRPDFAREQMTP